LAKAHRGINQQRIKENGAGRKKCRNSQRNLGKNISKEIISKVLVAAGRDNQA